VEGKTPIVDQDSSEEELQDQYLMDEGAELYQSSFSNCST
jgi:hypothetical protein